MMTRLQGQKKHDQPSFKGVIFEILSLYQATGPVACISVLSTYSEHHFPLNGRPKASVFDNLIEAQ